MSTNRAVLFEIALDALDLNSSDTVFIGDHWDDDVRGAQSAGLRPFWFNRSGLPVPDRAVPQLHDFNQPGVVDLLLY